MLLKFLLPYLSLCHLASWGLAQNLEGLGLFTYLNSQPMQIGKTVVYPLNLNPTIGVVSLAVFLTGVLALVFVLNVRATFYLNRWVGCTALALWTLPGVLSVLGYAPDVRGIGPDVFRYGFGFPGSVESAAANLFICLIGGWSAILLISSFWSRNTFKNAYDHVWYTVGLIAALYFVVDAGLSSYKEDLAEADGRVVRTLQLFAVAQRHLEVLCAQSGTKELSPDLCAMTPELKWSIHNYLDTKGEVRAKVDPAAWVSRLAGDPILGRQIAALNNRACTQSQQLAQCEKISADTALSIEDTDIPLTFPPPRYAKAIQQLHASMEKADQRIRDIEQGHNRRYFIFLVVAILAGGKLANASRAMIALDSVRPPSWILIVIRHVFKVVTILLKFLVALSRRTFQYFAQVAGSLRMRSEDVKAENPPQLANTISHETTNAHQNLDAIGAEAPRQASKEITDGAI